MWLQPRNLCLHSAVDANVLNRRNASAMSRNPDRELRSTWADESDSWSDPVKMVKLLGHHPNTVRHWDFVPFKTFPRYKTNQQSNLGWVKTFSWYQIRNLNNWCNQILFTASLVITLTWMLIWSPTSVGTSSLRCWRNSLAGHPPTTGTTRCHVLIDSWQTSADRLA